MCQYWTSEEVESFPPERGIIGSCPEIKDPSAYNNRITYCQSGRIDYERLTTADDTSQTTLLTGDVATILISAKRKAANNMFPGSGIIKVGQAGLNKKEIQALLESGFARRESPGFHQRLVVTENNRKEALKIAGIKPQNNKKRT
jgi:hypothetical protein